MKINERLVAANQRLTQLISGEFALSALTEARADAIAIIEDTERAISTVGLSMGEAHEAVPLVRELWQLLTRTTGTQPRCL
jgi:hypothetical protein